jgi:GxxExxY protein
MDIRGISYESQVAQPIEYKGVHLPKGYVIDMLVENAVIVEIKSVDKLLPIHSSQLMTYMRLREVSRDCNLCVFRVSVVNNPV